MPENIIGRSNALRAPKNTARKPHLISPSQPNILEFTQQVSRLVTDPKPLRPSTLRSLVDWGRGLIDSHKHLTRELEELMEGLENRLLDVTAVAKVAQSGHESFRHHLRTRSAWQTRRSIFSADGRPQRVQQFLALVRQHAREAYSVGEAARELGVGIRQLSRLVSASIQFPPGMVIDLARVCSLAEEIQERRASLKEISSAHGFPDQATMSRLFGRYTGVTPGDYRRN